MSNRRYNPSPSDLKHNVLDNSCHLLCRKFERNGEARRFSRESEDILILPLIHFNDDAIHPIVLLLPSPRCGSGMPARRQCSGVLPLLPIRNCMFDIRYKLIVSIHLEPKFPHVFELFCLRLRQFLRCLRHVVDKDIEIAR